jgi:hypothetical protein
MTCARFFNSHDQKLKLKIEKCHFTLKEIKYLTVIINAQDILADPTDHKDITPFVHAKIHFRIRSTKFSKQFESLYEIHLSSVLDEKTAKRINA